MQQTAYAGTRVRHPSPAVRRDIPRQKYDKISVLEMAEQWVPERSGRKLIVAGCMPSRLRHCWAMPKPWAQ